MGSPKPVRLEKMQAEACPTVALLWRGSRGMFVASDVMKVHGREGDLGGTAPRSPSLERLFFEAVVPLGRDNVSETFSPGRQ